MAVNANKISTTKDGTKLGQSILGKLGAFGTTPELQPANTRTARQALQDLGFLASGGAEKFLAQAVFDPSATAGKRTIAAHTLGVTIPALAVITRFFYQVNTTFTSATDAATIAFKVESAGDLLTAIAISDATNMFDAGIHAGKPGFPSLGADAAHDTQVEVAALFAATMIGVTEDRLITATVAVEALTAGKATLFVEYTLGA